MRKKALLIILAVVLILAFFDACLCVGMNYYVIPRFINPQLKRLLQPSPGLPLDISFAKLSFHPLRAFVFEDVAVSETSAPPDSYILRAPLVDINLSLLPLLFKQIDIKSITVFRPQLYIARAESGNWNIGFLFDFSKAGEENKNNSFRIRKIKVADASLNYEDRFRKGNTIRRTFVNLDLTLKNQRAAVYKLNLSVHSRDRRRERLELRLDGDVSRGRAEGRASFSTVYLSEYWDYYLDEMLKPWGLKAENVSGRMHFVYAGGNLSLSGEYKISGGALAYGDLNIIADADIKQSLRYIKGDSLPKDFRSEIFLRDGLFGGSRNVLVNGLKCRVLITQDEFKITDLSGMANKVPLSLSGSFIRRPQERLRLNGKLGDIDTELELKLFADNQGALEWQNKSGSSYLKLHSDITDVKDLLFDLAIEGNVKPADLLKSQQNIPSGEIVISGSVTGELDKSSSYEGNVNIQFENFSWEGFAPQSFIIVAPVKEGVLRGDIPELDYYGGVISGAIQMDLNRCGIELHLKKAYLEELLKSLPQSRDAKGVLSGSLACVAGWGALDSFRGGGYFKLTSGDLRGFPIFSVAESGIKSIIRGFIMPMFYSVEGNFSLDKEGVVIDNALCAGPTVDLVVSGKYCFSGATDFTVGVTLAGAGILKTAKHVMFIVLPFTIGIDFVTNSIQVSIQGDWPDLKQKTRLRPMAWFNNLLSFRNQSGPSKYTLDKLWPQHSNQP
ncbi:MAG: AsmA family protein [Candidatus Omnitrophota bacterium]